MTLLRTSAIALGVAPTWWIAGFGFVILELVVHAILHLRGQATFYDGRG
jgi:hypothetical protein